MPASTQPTFMTNSKPIDFGYRCQGPIEAVFHSHSHYEVYYFHEGICTYLIGDRIYTLQPGDLILMNGMTLHCAKIDPQVTYVRSICHFDPAALRPLLDCGQFANVLQPFEELGHCRISLSGDGRELIERTLLDMIALRDRTDAVSQGRFRLVFLDLLHIIYDFCRKPLETGTGGPLSEKEKKVQRVITYLERHYDDDLHFEELQEHLHVSKFYLSKLFKEVTGVTLFEFLYRRRINQAKIEFVLAPSRSVTDVCFQVGFKHLAHFSRMFKQQAGMTPEQFKRGLADDGS